MKTTSKILVCMLGAIFIFSSLGAVYATDPTPSPTPVPTPEIIPDPLLQIIDATAMEYLWLTLQAWGIDIEYRGYLYFADDVKTWLINKVFQYLESINEPMDISLWVSDWLATRDTWGNLIFNNPAIQDMQLFAQWLIGDLDLDDDDSIVINGTAHISGGYSTYRWNVFYALQNDINYIAINCSANIWQSGDPMNPSNGGYYFFFEETPNYGGGYGVILVSEIPFNQYGGLFTGMNYQLVRENGVIVENEWNNAGGSEVGNPSGLYWARIDCAFPSTYLPEGAIVYTIADQNNMSISYFMDNAELEMQGNLGIITSVINLPIDDSSYTPGDSITIINGQPDYSLIDWDGTVIVSNLPAVVSTGTIPVPGDELNPGMVDAWRPISSLISVVSDSMEVVIGIIYEFPEEVIIPIFAVMGGIIIFGLIHAMKEH